MALLALLSPVIYSYAATMLQPSSLPLGVRSVEWLRNNHGNWLVDEVEHVYYSWKAPKKGGAQLKALPAVGLAASMRTRRGRRHGLAAPDRAGLRPTVARRGGLEANRPAGGPTPVRPRHDLPQRARLPAHRRLCRLVRPRSGPRSSFYPGRYEPPNAPVRGPMSVPYGERWRLLATFNGGFTYIDGHNGSSINGLTYEPLKDGLATLIGYRDGRVDIETWNGGPDAGPNVAFARQSLPLIIRDGRLSPALNDSSQWGFTLGNAVRVWRTGVGIDRRGNLIYAAANDQTVITLARILQRAGAVRAMQFDINPEWPTLITYSHHRGLVPSKVVPNVQQPATRYLVPDDRDFFAVYRRLPGPVTVPFK